MLVEDVREQTEPGTYRQKVHYSEAVLIRKDLIEKGWKEKMYDKWNLFSENGTGEYLMGCGEFVLTLNKYHNVNTH